MISRLAIPHRHAQDVSRVKAGLGIDGRIEQRRLVGVLHYHVFPAIITAPAIPSRASKRIVSSTPKATLRPELAFFLVEKEDRCALGIEQLGRFDRNHVEQLFEVLFGIDAPGNVEQRRILLNDGVRRFQFCFHTRMSIIRPMTAQTFQGFPKEGLQFLRSLKRHNNREWFQKHKTIYENSVKKPMEDLINALADEFSRFAPQIVATVKASAYRIYRDTRFSKNKAPYKTHVAAVFPRKSLGKHEGAGFYLHIDPAEVLVGGGVYMPQPEDLKAVRIHIADHHKKLRSILQSPSFRRLFGELTGEKLSRVPRGFDPNHPAADYLRFKQFLAARTLKPEVALSPLLQRRTVESFREMLPLIEFLNEPILEKRRLRARQEAVLE